MREPWQDADDYYYEQDKWLAKRPVCCMCKEHIQEDVALHISSRKDGFDLWVCDLCADSFRETVKEDI